jgi:hypothetical protein
MAGEIAVTAARDDPKRGTGEEGVVRTSGHDNAVERAVHGQDGGVEKAARGHDGEAETAARGHDGKS